jgi:hypothetical protein
MLNGFRVRCRTDGAVRIWDVTSLKLSTNPDAMPAGQRRIIAEVHL